MNIALVGPGKVAHLHAQAALQVAGAKLVAICGRNAPRTEAFAQQYGIQSYNDVSEMVVQGKVDLTIICTPHPAHKDPTVAAFEAGSHVLVEKPLAATLADCDAMLAAAQKAGRHLGVVSQRRFYDPCQRMRQAIDAGKIGAPALGTVHTLSWRDEAYYRSDPWRGSWEGEGGGVLVNQATHQLDLLLWYMGEATEVYGLWSNLNHPYIEVDDTALAIVKFKNGGVGNIVLSNSTKPGIFGKVHIHGRNGASVGVQTDGGAMFIAGMSTIADPPLNDLWTVEGEADQLDHFRAVDTEAFRKIDSSTFYFARQIEDFRDAIQEGRSPLVTGEDGRRVVALFSAVYESTRLNQPVLL